MATLPTAGLKTNLQTPFLAGLLDKSDELGTFHS